MTGRDEKRKRGRTQLSVVIEVLRGIRTLLFTIWTISKGGLPSCRVQWVIIVLIIRLVWRWWVGLVVVETLLYSGIRSILVKLFLFFILHQPFLLKKFFTSPSVTISSIQIPFFNQKFHEPWRVLPPNTMGNQLRQGRDCPNIPIFLNPLLNQLNTGLDLRPDGRRRRFLSEHCLPEHVLGRPASTISTGPGGGFPLFCEIG